ncbi:MAG: ribosomal subunit interface protein [Bermanella sp.]|jgi:ribosomal subunit interface protein
MMKLQTQNIQSWIQESIMKVQVKARHFALTNELKQYVKRRLKFALGSRFDQVKRVEVMLSDINGPKGGEDKSCKILLKINGQTDVVVDDVQSHLYSAIDRAAGRASRTVSKRVTRLKHKAKRFKNAIKTIKAARATQRDRYLKEDFDEYEMAYGAS